MTERLNARIDPELSAKVKYLRRRTGQSTTQILKASIEAYYRQLTEQEKPATLLADFIGCAAGSPDLSESYKAELKQTLGKKVAR